MKVKSFRRLALLALIIAGFPVSAVAQSATANCLSADEGEALVTYALPATVRALSSYCAKTLPATAPLVQAGSVTAARYQVDADKAWPVASVAFDKMSDLPVAKMMGEKALKPLIEKAIAGNVVQNLQVKDCIVADRFINILQPLPTRNMAMLITGLLETGGLAKRAKLPITLCAPPVAPVIAAGASK